MAPFGQTPYTPPPDELSRNDRRRPFSPCPQSTLSFPSVHAPTPLCRPPLATSFTYTPLPQKPPHPRPPKAHLSPTDVQSRTPTPHKTQNTPHPKFSARPFPYFSAYRRTQESHTTPTPTAVGHLCHTLPHTLAGARTITLPKTHIPYFSPLSKPLLAIAGPPSSTPHSRPAQVCIFTKQNHAPDGPPPTRPPTPPHHLSPQPKGIQCNRRTGLYTPPPPQPQISFLLVVRAQHSDIPSGHHNQSQTTTDFRSRSDPLTLLFRKARLIGPEVGPPGFRS